MAATGCDGVVVGRGCLGRPWLFGDLLEVLAGRPAPPPRPLGVARAVMVDHARPSSPTTATSRWPCATFRKHASWYLTGYPVGGELRRRFGQVSTLAELDDLVAGLDPALTVVDGRRADPPRPHQRPDPRRPARRLPRRSRALEHDLTVPADDDVLALSGG